MRWSLTPEVETVVEALEPGLFVPDTAQMVIIHDELGTLTLEAEAVSKILGSTDALNQFNIALCSSTEHDLTECSVDIVHVEPPAEVVEELERLYGEVSFR